MLRRDFLKSATVAIIGAGLVTVPRADALGAQARRSALHRFTQSEIDQINAHVRAMLGQYQEAGFGFNFEAHRVVASNRRQH